VIELNRNSDDGTGCWPEKLLKVTIRINSEKGYTLLEMISVLVILGVMFSITMKKFEFLSDTASLTAIKAGVRELNTRETLEWTKIKLSDAGWQNDVDVFKAVDKQIGQGYGWDPPPDVSGGGLKFKSQVFDLNRKASTNNSVGVWY
jgi:prepilin-type N-terminal cleavage/methylation domain-containing protein